MIKKQLNLLHPTDPMEAWAETFPADIDARAPLAGAPPVGPLTAPMLELSTSDNDPSVAPPARAQGCSTMISGKSEATVTRKR